MSRIGRRKAGLRRTEVVTAGEREVRRRSAHQFCGGADPPGANWAIIVVVGKIWEVREGS